MSRVLANLVDNAVRHSPAGAPLLIRAVTLPSGVIELSVTDHGPGVDPGRRDEIFRLFARREGDAGAGLGLTIAKTFVEAHGQRIWVEDAPGGGARFCFTLPVALSVTDEPIAEEPQLAASSHHR
jgi:two-component system sensor histidine kinase KdpD